MPLGGRVLFEFDSDQRLLQETVREVVAKECPPALVRAVVDDGADTSPLWRTYAGLGWTELTDPTEALELALVMGGAGGATDPRRYVATMAQFPRLAPGVAQPDRTGTALFDRVSARREGDGWLLEGTAKYVLDGDRVDW